MPKRPSRPRSPLKQAPIFDIQRELAERSRLAAKLYRRRAWHMEQVAAIDAQLDRLCVSAPMHKRNQKTLNETIRSVMQDKQMSIPDIIRAVRATGYLTNAANFRVIVSTRLSTSGLFKRVGPGVYEVRKLARAK